MLKGDTGPLHLQPADRADLFARRLAHRVHDVPAAALASTFCGLCRRSRWKSASSAVFRPSTTGSGSGASRIVRSCSPAPCCFSCWAACMFLQLKQAFFPTDSAVSFHRGHLPAGGRSLERYQPDGGGRRSGSCARWRRTMARKHGETGSPGLRHDVCRAGRAALLVLDHARAAAAQLRATGDPGEGQARHPAPGRADPGGAVRAVDRRARGRAATGDGQAGRHSRSAFGSPARTSTTLKALAEQVKAIYRKMSACGPCPGRLGSARLSVKIETDSGPRQSGGRDEPGCGRSPPRRALSGQQVSVLREGDKQIPIVARLRPEERAQVRTSETCTSIPRRATKRVPIKQVARFVPTLEPLVVRRRNQFRTITVSVLPGGGTSALRSVERGAEGSGRVRGDAAGRLSAGDRRRERGAGEGLRPARDRAADLQSC